MPVFDYQCENCGHEWEQVVFHEATDEDRTCPKCKHVAGKQLISGRPEWTMYGFAARNGYGLKPFDDGR
ncbi:MAG: FmdB family zinc ribbon protein [Planctomycetota bacterium]